MITDVLPSLRYAIAHHHVLVYNYYIVTHDYTVSLYDAV